MCDAKHPYQEHFPHLTLLYTFMLYLKDRATALYTLLEKTRRVKGMVLHSPLVLLSTAKVSKTPVADSALVRTNPGVTHHVTSQLHVQNARVPAQTTDNNNISKSLSRQ